MDRARTGRELYGPDVREESGRPVAGPPDVLLHDTMKTFASPRSGELRRDPSLTDRLLSSSTIGRPFVRRWARSVTVSACSASTEPLDVAPWTLINIDLGNWVGLTHLRSVVHPSGPRRRTWCAIWLCCRFPHRSRRRPAPRRRSTRSTRCCRWDSPPSRSRPGSRCVPRRRRRTSRWCGPTRNMHRTDDRGRAPGRGPGAEPVDVRLGVVAVGARRSAGLPGRGRAEHALVHDDRIARSGPGACHRSGSGRVPGPSSRRSRPRSLRRSRRSPVQGRNDRRRPSRSRRWEASAPHRHRGRCCPA